MIEKITNSSTAEYFSRNLQMIGFSSGTKATLTILKESVDNALDACEEAGILPDIFVSIEKIGVGSHKGTDKIKIVVIDNGPGISNEDITRVFGEYLSSSKFNKGRCTRGMQGLGISACVSYAQQTNASGVLVITKKKTSPKAIKCIIDIDIKNNKGIIKNKELIDWDRQHGTSVEFIFDGRIQLNGDSGILTYLNGSALVNPHMKLIYRVPEQEEIIMERVVKEVPEIPDPVLPHLHTLKLGDFITLSHTFRQKKTRDWLKKGFSRINESVINEISKNSECKKLINKNVGDLTETDIKILFKTIQEMTLLSPLTKSVMSIGEEAFSKSINRLGSVDFFAVLSRKPTVCDFKPVLIEVAIARLTDVTNNEDPVQVLRFANRVPLLFDKSSCCIIEAIQSVSWKVYGLVQSKNALPLGPYVIAVSVISPFIKFKNSSKETIDSSDELVEEIRRALIQAGQKLSKHIKHENKAYDLEQRLKHIEQFCPILVDKLCSITKSSGARKKRAEEGIIKILGRDTKTSEQELKKATTQLDKAVEKGDIQQKQEINEDD